MNNGRSIQFKWIFSELEQKLKWKIYAKKYLENLSKQIRSSTERDFSLMLIKMTTFNNDFFPICFHRLPLHRVVYFLFVPFLVRFVIKPSIHITNWSLNRIEMKNKKPFVKNETKARASDIHERHAGDRKRQKFIVTALNEIYKLNVRIFSFRSSSKWNFQMKILPLNVSFYGILSIRPKIRTPNEKSKRNETSLQFSNHNYDTHEWANE